MSYETIGTKREDLQLLIDKLDDKEVDIVLAYIANLLLVGAAVMKEDTHNGPRC
jgi:hypothetical protein